MKEALDAGCTLFDFSPDGASNNALGVLGKDLTVESIKKSIELVSQFEDIKVAYEFMSSVPKYDTEQALGLLSIVPRIVNSCKTKLVYVSNQPMRVYPHTALYQIALREGKLSERTSLLRPVYYQNRERSSLRRMVNSVIRVSCTPVSAIHRLKKLTRQAS